MLKIIAISDENPQNCNWSYSSSKSSNTCNHFTMLFYPLEKVLNRSIQVLIFIECMLGTNIKHIKVTKKMRHKLHGIFSLQETIMDITKTLAMSTIKRIYSFTNSNNKANFEYSFPKLEENNILKKFISE